ncbi:MAG: phosphoribosylglycinamide formyltransferase [Acidimicrobiia bacterium]|nr:phosphoribosylglycinamide formyltransferase [Acidimicrobiia bacterium]
MRLGVLASGSGTILRAILDRGLPVVVVVVDRACGAVEVARGAGVPVEVVERTEFGPSFDRVGYTRRVVEVLTHSAVDLVAMAGFMTILESPLFDAYGGRITNTHPALLPAFKGARAVEAAVEAGVKVTGCTVHIATLDVDDGPILAQEAVEVLPGDTVETLHERIKEVERRLYPGVLDRLVRGDGIPTAKAGPAAMRDER